MTDYLVVNSAKIHELVLEIARDAKKYLIFPPRELASDPAVLCRDSIVQDLEKSHWWLAIQGGTEALLTFAELLTLLQKLRYLARTVAEQGINGSGMLVRFPELSRQELFDAQTVKELLSTVELEGFSALNGKYCARFPVYTLARSDASDPELLSIAHPHTGQPVLLVFTDEDNALQFAEQLGGVEVIKLADTPAGLKRSLRHANSQIIAFDPVIYTDELQVKFQTRVSNVLSS